MAETNYDEITALLADNSRNELLAIATVLVEGMAVQARSRRSYFAAISAAAESMNFAARREVTKKHRRELHAGVRNHLNAVVEAGMTEINVPEIFSGKVTG